MRILAADIGGTKTLLRLMEGEPRALLVKFERRYESALFPSLELMLDDFLRDEDGTIDAACLAVAGPVFGDRATVTNLDWPIQGSSIASRYSIAHVRLVNDFFAVAAGVPFLETDDLISLNRGSRERAPIAILGAGTGLGEAFVIPVEDRWRVISSEGGHADFAPTNEIQRELLAVLERRYGGHVSYERILSGPGLSTIYTFLSERSRAPRRDDGRDDLPSWISEQAGRGDEIAVDTFGLFVDVFAAEAGNLALKVLARGGVFLAGGIAAKNIDRFTDGRFVRGFTGKGRFREFLEQVPVDLITNSKVGLIGAADIAAGIARS